MIVISLGAGQGRKVEQGWPICIASTASKAAAQMLGKTLLLPMGINRQPTPHGTALCASLL